MDHLQMDSDELIKYFESDQHDENETYMKIYAIVGSLCSGKSFTLPLMRQFSFQEVFRLLDLKETSMEEETEMMKALNSEKTLMTQIMIFLRKSEVDYSNKLDINVFLRDLLERAYLEEETEMMKLLESKNSFITQIVVFLRKSNLDYSNKLHANPFMSLIRCRWKDDVFHAFQRRKKFSERSQQKTRRSFKELTLEKEENYDQNQTKQKLCDEVKYIKISGSELDENFEEMVILLKALVCTQSSESHAGFVKNENFAEEICPAESKSSSLNASEDTSQSSNKSFSSIIAFYKTTFAKTTVFLATVFQNVACHLFEKTSKPFEAERQNYFSLVKKICSESLYEQNEETLLQKFERNAFKAFNIAALCSLAQLTASVQRWSKHVESMDEEVVYTSACLLNCKNCFIKSFCEINDVVVQTKRRIIQQLVENLFEAYLNTNDSDQRRLSFLYACADGLGCYELRGRIEKSSKVFLFSALTQAEETTDVEMNDIAADGRIYSRVRDPPGQRSVYIPPGNPSKEAYRLSTYIKFPQISPVNLRQLAAAGFYYTGYKDRVKCFCCAYCVENWMSEDDVGDARWHNKDCMMMLSQDCGNIPIGKRVVQQGSKPEYCEALCHFKCFVNLLNKYVLFCRVCGSNFLQ